jgi:NADH-quinone oxidoreductase subunit M
VGFFFSFASKVPMYPFHIWLPEAHVEAPTAGSMILAGLLLKLGGYGFIRFSLFLFPFASFYFSSFVYVLAIISIVYSSCIALIQIDFKKLIAYSSIAHMNMSVLGIFSNNINGLYGGYILMLGHGLISVALFFLVGCIYERYHEKLIDYYGGLSHVSPVLCFFFFYFIISNFGFPCSLNFLGEVLVFMGVYDKNFFVLILLIFSGVIGVCYNIYFYEKMFLGTLNTKYIKVFIDLSKREFFVILPLFVSSLVLLLKPMILLEYFNFF